MTEQDPTENPSATDKRFIRSLVDGLADELDYTNTHRNRRAWDIYKEIAASSGIYHNYMGTIEHQGCLRQIATFALSAVECFDDAVEDYDS
ncbi:hypothetical protein [Okeania sp. SIO1I7]|uniref:hypothetical protein n=1 Tax=Okeania sp. SIO1I7 TaxID=2607772 RepID=UPI0013F8761A|nr:hypothetical protein [Okeania sp. SIO1I7]NET30006.1 hypothetical protein [Okeania sp. SIO1I7]